MQPSATVTTHHVSSSRGDASVGRGGGGRGVSATVSASMASATRRMARVPAHQGTVGSSVENHVQLASMVKTAGTGVGIAKVSSHVRSQKDAASLVTEAGMGHAVISSVLKDSLVKTAKRSVPLVKMVTTATLYMASAPTVTPAGLGTGVRCAVPMALMVRTARTTAVTALMVSVMLSPESASVTQAFMEPIAM